MNEADFLERGEKLNIRYFVQCHFVLKTLKSQVKEFTEIKKYLSLFNALDFNAIGDKAINNAIKKVHQIYIDKGRSDSIAKAKYFTEAVINYAINNLKHQQIFACDPKSRVRENSVKG